MSVKILKPAEDVVLGVVVVVLGVGGGAGGSTSRRAPVNVDKPVYGVVDFQSIKSCEYIVKDFANPGFFHVSAFKWDRGTVGFKEDTVDAFGAHVTS
jgi:hypothetical protein